MIKFIHLLTLAGTLVALVIASTIRHIDLWPSFEPISYLAAVLAIRGLLVIYRSNHLPNVTGDFAFAMVVLAFCIWTGGSGWEGVQHLPKVAILIGGYLFLWIASRWLSYRSFDNQTPREAEQGVDDQSAAAVDTKLQ